MYKTELILDEIIEYIYGKSSYFIIPEEMKTYIKIFSIKIITTEDIRVFINDRKFIAIIDPLVLKGKNILNYHQPIYIKGELLSMQVLTPENFGPITICEICWIPLEEYMYKESFVNYINIGRLRDGNDIELYKNIKLVIYSLLPLNKGNFEIIHAFNDESTIYTLENNPLEHFHFLFVSPTELFIKCYIESIQDNEYFILNYNDENRNSIYPVYIRN